MMMMRDTVFLILSVATLWFHQNQQQYAVVVESWSSTVFPSRSTSSNNQSIRITRHQISCWSSSSSPSPSSPFNSRSSSTTAFAVTSDSNDDDYVVGDGDGDDDDDDDEKYMEIESLSSGQILELIELSFFQACFALSKGDVEPLKLFIVAVKTAAKKFEGASASTITQTVNSMPPSVRPLEPQEQELRDTWIRAIYLVLFGVVEDFADYGNGSGGDGDGDGDGDDKESVAQLYGPILVDLVAIHKTGLGLNVNQFVETRKEILLPPKDNLFVLEDGLEDDDMLQLAVVTQTINVMFTTLVVLGEEQNNSDTTPTEEDDEETSESSSASASSKMKKKKKKSSGGGMGFG